MKLSDEKTVEHLIAVFRDDGSIYVKKCLDVTVFILIWSQLDGLAMGFFG